MQAQIVGLCHFLTDDCKEDLPHWKQLLQQDEVITRSLCGITDNELFYKVLATEKCKAGIISFQQCLWQCSCPRCKYLLNLLSMVIEDDKVSTSDIQKRNDWYVLKLSDHSIMISH